MDQTTPPPPPPPIQPSSQFWQADALQQQRDREHLKILAIMYYIFGGLNALGGCAGLFYVVIGIVMAANPNAFTENGNEPPPPEWLGGMMIGLGGCIVLVAAAYGALLIYTGHCLATQRHRVFCMVMAVISCLSIPLGTVLGIFTLIVLARPSVAAMFEQPRA